MSDPDEDLATAQAAEHKRRYSELQDLRWLVEHPSGARVLRRILARSGPLRRTMGDNDRQSCFNEGQRDIGLWIFAEAMEAAPAAAVAILADIEKPTRLDAVTS